MAETAKLLFFAGSTRQDSFNRKLAQSAQRLAADRGYSADFIELSDYPMPLYNGDLEASEGHPENARRLRHLFAGYQGIFIASPEYNASITPLLKNTLDWVSRVKGDEQPPVDVYKTRVFAIGGASPGGYGGMRSLITLRQILALGLGALVIPEQVAVGGASSAFDDAGRLTNDRAQSMLEALIDRLHDAAQRFHS